MKAVAQSVYEHILTKDVGSRFTVRDIANEMNEGANRISAAFNRMLRAEMIKQVGRLAVNKHHIVYELIEKIDIQYRRSCGLGIAKQRSGGGGPRLAYSLPIIDGECIGVTVKEPESREFNLVNMTDIVLDDPSWKPVNEPSVKPEEQKLSDILLDFASRVEELEKRKRLEDYTNQELWDELLKRHHHRRG